MLSIKEAINWLESKDVDRTLDALALHLDVDNPTKAAENNEQWKAALGQANEAVNALNVALKKLHEMGANVDLVFEHLWQQKEAGEKKS